jgi:hypothetical protein
MTIYEGDSNVWEEGMVVKEEIVLSDYSAKVNIAIIHSALFPYEFFYILLSSDM